ATLASFVGLTEVLFAVVFAWLLLGQRLELVQLAGGVLVVAGIALVRLDEIRSEPTQPVDQLLRDVEVAAVDLSGRGLDAALATSHARPVVRAREEVGKVSGKN